MDQKCLDALLDDFFDGNPWVRERNRQLFKQCHIDQPASYELPENSGAITETYTAEEAKQWIVEYNEAMSNIPQADTD